MCIGKPLNEVLAKGHMTRFKNQCRPNDGLRKPRPGMALGLRLHNGCLFNDGQRNHVFREEPIVSDGCWCAGLDKVRTR